MKHFHDLSSVVDFGYKLSKHISKGSYDQIFYYEFHRIIDGEGVLNFDSGFDLFRDESSDYYSTFISPGFVDETQAEISVVVQIGDHYFYSKDCSSNYYLGFGPGGLLMLRKACKEKRVICMAYNHDIDAWLQSQARGADSNFFHSPEIESFNQFEVIMKVIRQFVSQAQRNPNELKGLNEENIRNRLLLSLNPAFNGRCNGEAVNGNGKTDILVRTQGGTNEHIFELKIWSGIQSIQNSIIQLSGYLADHNSHCGLLFFADRDGFNEILTKSEEYLKLNFGNVRVYDRQEFIFQIPKLSDSTSKITVHLVFINFKH